MFGIVNKKKKICLNISSSTESETNSKLRVRQLDLDNTLYRRHRDLAGSVLPYKT